MFILVHTHACITTFCPYIRCLFMIHIRVSYRPLFEVFQRSDMTFLKIIDNSTVNRQDRRLPKEVLDLLVIFFLFFKPTLNSDQSYCNAYLFNRLYWRIRIFERGTLLPIIEYILPSRARWICFLRGGVYFYHEKQKMYIFFSNQAGCVRIQVPWSLYYTPYLSLLYTIIGTCSWTKQQISRRINIPKLIYQNVTSKDFQNGQFSNFFN